jgi:hypothetical protein
VPCTSNDIDVVAAVGTTRLVLPSLTGALGQVLRSSPFTNGTYAVTTQPSQSFSAMSMRDSPVGTVVPIGTADGAAPEDSALSPSELQAARPASRTRVTADAEPYRVMGAILRGESFLWLRVGRSRRSWVGFTQAASVQR